jgi:RNA polymerase sigma-70 factor (ECF subfamily)
MPADQERALLERCRRGDEAAWAELYRAWSPDVALFIRGVLGQRTDTDDLVQRVFLELLSSLGRFRGDARLRTWLHRIATHVVKKEIRSAVRHRRKVDAVAACTLVAPPLDDAGRRGARERLRVIEQALAELPIEFRMVWVMIELEEMDVEEVASALRIPRPTVRSRLGRARTRLQEAIAALDRIEDDVDDRRALRSALSGSAEVMP